MKLFGGTILFTLLAVSGVLSLPAGTPQDDAEVIAVPKRRPVFSEDPDFHDFKGVIDTGAGYPFLQPNPHTFSFNLGFFDSFEDIFRRLRTRLWPVVSVPGVDDSDSDGDSGEGSFTFNLTPTIPKNSNTTSTVKVVDGHKVEVNETVYGDSNSVFKVRVVNIRPLESGEVVEETVTTNTEVNKEQPLKPLGSINPVTSAPNKKINEFVDEDDDSQEEEEDSKREPLSNKKPIDNEINPEIIGSQSLTESTTISTTKSQIQNNIAVKKEAEIIANIDDDQVMLPTETNSEDIAFVVTDNSQEQVEDTTLAMEVQKDLNDSFEQQQQQFSQSHASLTIDNGDDVEEKTELPNIEVPEVIATIAETDHNGDISDDDDGDDDADDDVDNEDDDERGKQHAHPYSLREDAESSDDESTEPVEMNPTFNSEWGTLAEDLAQANDAENALNNDIDAYDTVPVDLSNDIAVNDAAAADPDFQPNPDAEFIDVIGINAAANSMPKFEKLSLSTAIEPTSYQQDELATAHEMK